MRDEYGKVTAGGIPGYAETDRRVWWDGPKQLIQFTADGVQTDGDLATSTFEAFCGDARIRLRLDVGFVPEGALPSNLWDISLVTTDPAIPPVFFHDVLGRTLIWLAGCADIGGVVRETENLVGTDAVPVRLAAGQLWGATYEVDQDFRSVRGRVKPTVPGLPGRWVVRAKWTAIDQMSEEDWRQARQRMQLIVRPGYTGPVADNVLGPE